MSDTWRTDAVRLTKRLKDQYTPRERAALRGWSIDPQLTRGPEHAWMDCQCKKRTGVRSYCPCGHHGRAYVHYLRGG